MQIKTFGTALATVLGFFFLSISTAHASGSVVLHALGNANTTLTASFQDHGGQQKLAFDLASSDPEILKLVQGSRVTLRCNYYETPSAEMLADESFSAVSVHWPKGQSAVRAWDNQEVFDVSVSNKWRCTATSLFGQSRLLFISDLQGVGSYQLQVENSFHSYMGDFLPRFWLKNGYFPANVCWAMMEDYSIYDCVSEKSSTQKQHGVVYQGKRTALYTDLAYLVGTHTVRYRTGAWDYGIVGSVVASAFPPRIGSTDFVFPRSAKAAAAQIQKSIRDIPGNRTEQVISVGVYSKNNKPHSYQGRHVGLWVRKMGSKHYTIYGRFGKTAQASWDYNRSISGGSVGGWPGSTREYFYN